jgi:hypothetical protein
MTHPDTASRRQRDWAIGRKQERQIRVRLAAGDGILRVAREEGVGTGTV